MKTRIFNPLTGEFDYVGEITGDYVVQYSGDYIAGDYVEECVGIKVNIINNESFPTGTLSMAPDNRYIFSSPVGLMLLSLQDVPKIGRAYSYELDFVAGDNISVRLPDDVCWLRAPVFKPGKRYLVSMEMSLVGTVKKIIGMYLEMEV